MKLPNAAMNFLWRLAKGILPLKHNMSRKSMQIDPTCMLWHFDLETEDHLFIMWHAKKNVPPPGFGISENIDSHVWLLNCFNCKDNVGVQLVCATPWKI